MAIVRILNNSINPKGWNSGDEVELTMDQGLFDLRDQGAVDVVEYTKEELEAMKPKKEALKKEVKLVQPIKLGKKVFKK